MGRTLEIQARDIDLEDDFLAQAGAVQLERFSPSFDRIRKLDAGHFGAKRESGYERKTHGEQPQSHDFLRSTGILRLGKPELRCSYRGAPAERGSRLWLLAPYSLLLSPPYVGAYLALARFTISATSCV